MDYAAITKCDFDVFHQLAGDYYREGEDAGTPQAVLDTFIRILFDKVMSGEIQGCFAKSGPEYMGFALWAMDTGDFDFSEMPGYGTILEIGLVKGRRLSGCGRKLVSYIEECLREAGAASCYVSAYGPAQKFWSRCGYVENGKTASNGLPVMVKAI